MNGQSLYCFDPLHEFLYKNRHRINRKKIKKRPSTEEGIQKPIEIVVFDGAFLGVKDRKENK